MYFFSGSGDQLLIKSRVAISFYLYENSEERAWETWIYLNFKRAHVLLDRTRAIFGGIFRSNSNAFHFDISSVCLPSSAYQESEKLYESSAHFDQFASFSLM